MNVGAPCDHQPSALVVVATAKSIAEADRVLRREGLLVTEVAPGTDLERDVLGQMGFRPGVSPDVKTKDARIFQEGLMGLRQTG
jgi:acyl CoA:acetate/3-ketoacid CoA transferase